MQYDRLFSPHLFRIKIKEPTFVFTHERKCVSTRMQKEHELVTVQRCHGHRCQAILIRRRASLVLSSSLRGCHRAEERSLETRRWRPCLKYDSHSSAPSLPPSLSPSIPPSFPTTFPKSLCLLVHSLTPLFPLLFPLPPLHTAEAISLL